MPKVSVIIPTYNHARFLAAAIRSLFRDPDRREELGRRGRERCREFAVDRMVERSEAVYRELLPGAFPG